MLPLTKPENETGHMKHGKLDLCFEDRLNHTKLIDCFQKPPLKASRVLYPDGGKTATVYLMESSGGMVAGDYNEYNVHVKEGASVCLKPQSATKVYPSFNDMFTRQKIGIILEEQAELEWSREEIIPYKNSSFRGATTIEMSSSSSLLWGEILYPGREKRGESFLFNQFHSHFEVWVEDECLAYDSLRLDPSEQNLQHIGVLEHFNYVGSVWFISPKVADLDEKIINAGLHGSHQHRVGVTRLNGNGMLIRWLSNSLPTLKKEMGKAFQLFK